MKDVVRKELENAPYRHLVLGAPTVDISNLDTSKVKPSDNIDGFKQKAEDSCKNMMNIAEESLSNNPNLEKVTIMNHTPRFDNSDLDPVNCHTRPILKFQPC